jgi:hypothetical protein
MALKDCPRQLEVPPSDTRAEKYVPLLGRQAAAHFLTERGFPTAKRTLEKLASAGGGPVYRVFGRRVIYRASDLLEWAEARLSPPRRHTSEQAKGGDHGKA